MTAPEPINILLKTLVPPNKIQPGDRLLYDPTSASCSILTCVFIKLWFQTVALGPIFTSGPI